MARSPPTSRTRYRRLWAELTAARSSHADETVRVEQRLRRLHDLGFDVDEMELVADDGRRPPALRAARRRARLPPGAAARADRARAGENQARRLLDDIRSFGAELQARTGTRTRENVVAVRWLDQRFEPIIAVDPDRR